MAAARVLIIHSVNLGLLAVLKVLVKDSLAVILPALIAVRLNPAVLAAVLVKGLKAVHRQAPARVKMVLANAVIGAASWDLVRDNHSAGIFDGADSSGTAAAVKDPGK